MVTLSYYPLDDIVRTSAIRVRACAINHCATCHMENPAAKPVAQDKYIACHGDLKKVGSKPIPKGEVNAHINHVDEMYCNDCHNIHKLSQGDCRK